MTMFRGETVLLSDLWLNIENLKIDNESMVVTIKANDIRINGKKVKLRPK